MADIFETTPVTPVTPAAPVAQVEPVTPAQVLTPNIDPFATQHPDLARSLEDRPVGGMGLHSVKTIMDTLGYRRMQEENVLTMSKNVLD